MKCIFCSIAETNIPKHDVVWEDDKHIAFTDARPVTAGHTIVIPKHHAEDLDSLNEAEYTALFKAVRLVSSLLKAKYGSHKVGVVVEGTSVPHLHVHLIPLMQGESINELVNRKG